MCAKMRKYPLRFHQYAEKAKKRGLRNGLLLTNYEKHITLLTSVLIRAETGKHILHIMTMKELSHAF
jgi:hypothetical protein